MAKKDYPELEGKEVDYIQDGKNITGVVAGVNFDIGITIEQKDPEKEERCVCLHGPSYKPADGNSNYAAKSYKTEFYTAVAMVKKGMVRSSVLGMVERLKSGRNHDSPFGSVGTCSFT